MSPLRPGRPGGPGIPRCPASPAYPDSSKPRSCCVNNIYSAFKECTIMVLILSVPTIFLVLDTPILTPITTNTKLILFFQLYPVFKGDMNSQHPFCPDLIHKKSSRVMKIKCKKFQKLKVSKTCQVHP